MLSSGSGRDLAVAAPAPDEVAPTELDVAVAAHALAHVPEVIVGTPTAAARMPLIQRFSGLGVQHWGREADRGKNLPPT